MARVGVGIDLALRKGAVVKMAIDGDSAEASTIVKWRKGPKSKIDPATMVEFFQSEIIKPLAKAGITDAPIGIDWSPEEIFFRGMARPPLMKAFIAGYLYRYLLSKGHRTIFISPSVIRDLLGLSRRADKEAVWASFVKLTPATQMLASTLVKMNKDEKDALVLAFYSINLSPSIKE
jgi:hypothetical protein